MALKLLFLSALAATTLASPTPNARVLHEKRSIFTSKKGARVEHDAIIPIRIALQQTNLENGYDAVMDVSDPESANYGKHWSLDDVRSYFAPSEESVEAVKNWLIGSGIPSEQIAHSHDKAWIAVDIPAKQAEDLFGAEYHEHETMDDTLRIGCDEYHLPSHISKHVDYIKPGISLSPPLNKKIIKRDDNVGGPNNVWHQPWSPYRQPPQFRPPQYPHGPMPPHARPLPPDLRTCGYNITPACIRALYDIPRNHINNPENTLGVYETIGDAYSQADLNLYFKNFAPYVPQGTHPTLDSIDGGVAPVPQRRAGAESDIDFDIVFSLIYPQSVTLYQVGVPNVNYTNRQFENQVTFLSPFLDGIDGSFCTTKDRNAGLQCGTYPLTRVLSASYGSPELYMGQPAEIRACNELMKLSLQGHTILFASGDYGVAGSPTRRYNGCIPADLNLNGREDGTIFSPDFPSNCPYVLSVGATQLYGNETTNDPEYVMDVPGLSPNPEATFSSGGGFSNYFPRPSYQDAAVQNYLDNYAPPYPSYVYNGNDVYSGQSNIGANGGLYNRAGRGFPDVSANGANLTAFYRGGEYNFYGTSLATPIWASVITLINEERSQAGKGPVGFVQPVLYAHPEVFHDITLGTNPGCGTQGFPASPGWDPSSGLGTPNFPELQKLFVGLPAGYGPGNYTA